MDKTNSNAGSVEILCTNCYRLTSVGQNLCDNCGALLNGEVTNMAQAFREAARYRQTDPPREKGATMTQWPNVQPDRNGTVVPGTAVALPLSNEQVIRRIEHTAAIADIENGGSQSQLDEVIVSSFVESYLRPLSAATREEVTRREDGTTVLPRRAITQNDQYVSTISYGYSPAEVAFALKQLHDLLTKATAQGADRKKLRISEEMLLGFSCVLGYYNLCCYLLELPVEEDALWLQKLCDLSVSYSALGSTIRGAKSWLQNNLPPRYGDAPDAPCRFANNGSWNGSSETLAAGAIIAVEKNRLLAFRKSLYMYLAVIASHTD